MSGTAHAASGADFLAKNRFSRSIKVYINTVFRRRKMAEEQLDPELVKRIKLVEKPDYEGDPLTGMDYVLLFVVGLIIPAILMIWGWS
jgi:hypothetical protein